MANESPMPRWRNFAAWSAMGALFYFLAVWGGAMLLKGEGLGTILNAMLQSTRLAVTLGLGLIFAMAVFGFTTRKRPFNLRTLRNFAIQNAVAVAALLLVIGGFSALARTGAMSASVWAAAVTGATLIVVAFLGSLATASVRAGADLVDDELAADDMRERGRLILCSLVWIAACGLLLILLALAGPGGLLSPMVALAGALILIAILIVLGIAAWQLSDELGRTLSRETGNIAFYLILLFGGGWAVLAHLGFAVAPAPLDWLTMVTVLMFAASLIAAGRRGSVSV